MLNLHRALALVFLSSAVLLPSATAQKPILVRNADEPGKTPYQQSVYLDQGPTCLNRICEVNLPAVPAGNRLVVTQVSLRFATSGDTSWAYFSVNSTPTFTTNYTQSEHVYLPATAVAPGFYVTGSPVSLYVEPTIAPSFTIYASGELALSGQILAATVIGYLVPLP